MDNIHMYMFIYIHVHVIYVHVYILHVITSKLASFIVVKIDPSTNNE